MMRQRGGFRRARRATRKLDIDGIVEVQARRYRVHLLRVMIVRECDDIIEIEHARRFLPAEANDDLQVG